MKIKDNDFFLSEILKDYFWKDNMLVKIFESEYVIKVMYCLFNGLKLKSFFYYVELKLYCKILYFKFYVFFSYNCYL